MNYFFSFLLLSISILNFANEVNRSFNSSFTATQTLEEKIDQILAIKMPELLKVENKKLIADYNGIVQNINRNTQSILEVISKRVTVLEEKNIEQRDKKINDRRELNAPCNQLALTAYLSNFKIELMSRLEEMERNIALLIASKEEQQKEINQLGQLLSKQEHVSPTDSAISSFSSKTKKPSINNTLQSFSTRDLSSNDYVMNNRTNNRFTTLLVAKQRVLKQRKPIERDENLSSSDVSFLRRDVKNNVTPDLLFSDED